MASSDVPEPCLRISGLGVRLRKGGAPLVDDISFDIRPGETLALVGESGSGKSLTSLAILRLLPRSLLARGRIEFAEAGATVNLGTIDISAIRRIRGNRIAMIFQEPMTSLNPVFTVGEQISEGLRLHKGLTRREALDRALELMGQVGIPDAEGRLSAYPHELSGGMRQRVMIATALSCDPEILIADEPTTALDVTIQAQILDLIRKLQAQRQMAVLFITHDLGVVAEMADRVAVMYSGRIIEEAPVAGLFADPAHPYTRALLALAPRIHAPGETPPPIRPIPGIVPDPQNRPSGCAFHPRCAHFLPGLCDAGPPPQEDFADGHRVRCFRRAELTGGALHA